MYNWRTICERTKYRKYAASLCTFLWLYGAAQRSFMKTYKHRRFPDHCAQSFLENEEDRYSKDQK